MRNLYRTLPAEADIEDAISWIIDVTRNRRFDLEDFDNQAANNPVLFSVPTSSTDLIGTEKAGDIATDENFLYVVVNVGGALEWRTVPLTNFVSALSAPVSSSFCATGAGTNINGTIATVGLSVEQVGGADYSLSGDEVAVLGAGDYQVSYSIQIDEDTAAGGTRGRVTGSVENNNTPIEQSFNSCYVREASGGSGVSGCFNVSLSANDVLRLRVQMDQGNTDISVERAQLSIARL